MNWAQCARVVRRWRALFAGVALGCVAFAVSAAAVVFPAKSRAEAARTLWMERCQRAGEFIHRQVRDVEGLLLLKLRPGPANRWDQFVLDDPYGRDLEGDGYIGSFLRGAYRANNSDIPDGVPPRTGYLWVEAVDPNDGVRYRYTGAMEEPWLRDKRFLKGYRRFELRRVPAEGLQPRARYGVTYDDISTQEDRQLWIAGSALRVVDLVSGEVIAERIGYMFDALQGLTSAGRQPWSYAADNACPRFERNLKYAFRDHAVMAQPYQTLDFVEKVLIPIH